MAVNKYGNNKPVVKEKKVKTEILLEVGTGLDAKAKSEGKELLGTKRKFGKLYSVYKNNINSNTK